MASTITARCRICAKFRELDPTTMLCMGCYLDYLRMQPKQSKHLNSN